MPIVMDKKVGETPLACLGRLRSDKPELADLPMTYAGRLDPMADGLLLVLVGEECKQKENFLGLDKEYVYEILWGVSTDTYDILGKIINLEKDPVLNLEKFSVPDFSKFIGKHQQKFPPFSSKPVKGKPLHEWARADQLEEIEIPSKEIVVREIELLSTEDISLEKIKEKVLSRLLLVKGDFRQKEIIDLWQKYFDSMEKLHQNLSVSKVRVACSTGTYIRGLVQEIGQKSGFGATVLSLTRTKVGDYRLI